MILLLLSPLIQFGSPEFPGIYKQKCYKMIKTAFAILLLSSILSYAQSIELKLGGNANFSLSTETNSDPNIPREYQDIREVPSVSNFYKDNFNLAPEILFRYSDEGYVYKLGLAYQNYTYESKNSDNDIILGKELQISKITPAIYIGKYLHNPAFNIYALIGLAFQNTKAENDIPGANGLSARYKYKNSTNFLAGIGAELNKSNLILGLSLKGEFGSFERDYVDLYDKGTYLLSLEPTGDKQIVNNTIILNFYIGYSIDLWSTK